MSGEAPLPAELELPAPLLEAIYRHARAEFPKECCGYILGRGADARHVECVNYQDRYHAVDPASYPRTAETAYTFGGKDARALADSLDSSDPATIVYHSHPRVGAYFSAEDARAADSAGWPVDYLVIDCQDASIREAKLFRRRDDGSGYDEVARYPGAPL